MGGEELLPTVTIVVGKIVLVVLEFISECVQCIVSTKNFLFGKC